MEFAILIAVIGAGALLFFSPKAEGEEKETDIINAITAPRGIRNNNPGNLRYYSPINWVGQLGDDGGGYAVFDKMENGIRASFINLRTYYQKHGLDTIEEIIKRWAPKEENPTNNYINFVSEKTGIKRNVAFTFNEANAVKILDAIFWFENGERVDQQKIIAGVRAA